MKNYNYAAFNHSNPFELKLTGAELESLVELLDKEKPLSSELQIVRADLHSFLTTFNLKEIREMPVRTVSEANR